MDYSKYTILIVDDVPVNVMIVEKLLTNYHFNIMKANDGQSALDMAAASQPDLILLDIMMPGIDGFETLQRLRSNPDLPHIPVILMSALNSDADIKKGLSLGANDYLTKPVIKEQLDKCIKNHLKPKAGQGSLETAQREPETPVDLSIMLRSYLFCSGRTAIKHLLKQIVLSVPQAWIDNELFNALSEKDDDILRNRMIQWVNKKINDHTPDFEETDTYRIIHKIAKCINPVIAERNITLDINDSCRMLTKTSPALLESIIRTLIVSLGRICSDCHILITGVADNGNSQTLTISGQTQTDDKDIELCVLFAKEMAAKAGCQLTAVKENGNIAYRIAL